jgi:hypothetical protein
VVLPSDSPVPARPAPQPDISRAGATAIAFAILYSLALAAGGGYVFYASIRPVSIDVSYGAPLVDLPWAAAAVLLAAAWAAGPVALLISGLLHLCRAARRKRQAAAAWLAALAAGTSTGYLILHGYRLLATASPKLPDGTPLGPSRWAPGSPYWPSLIAAAGQLAVGAAMIALIIATAREGETR